MSDGNGATPAQPQFPMTNLQITPDGMLISIMFGPGLVLNQVINEETMNAICKKWLETRKELKKQQQLVQDVLRTKAR